MPYPSREEVLAARTRKGGWKRATLNAWGVPWPPPKGWRKELQKLWATERRGRVPEPPHGWSSPMTTRNLADWAPLVEPPKVVTPPKRKMDAAEAKEFCAAVKEAERARLATGRLHYVFKSHCFDSAADPYADPYADLTDKATWDVRPL